MTDHLPREEFLRAAVLCAPGFERLPDLTLAAHPSGVLDVWRTAIWEQHLVPAFLDARDAVHAGARELQSIDRRLDAVLIGPAAAASRDAARWLVENGGAPAGERTVARYLREAPAAAPHFVTLFAARSAIFHVPPHAALGGLLLIELRPLTLRELWPAMAHCLPGPELLGPRLRAA